MITIEEEAEIDLEQIRDYIARDSLFYANKTIYNIYGRIENLLLFPELGKKVQIYGVPARQLIYKSYKIFYRFNSKNIYILRIIHHSRQFFNLTE